MSKTVIGSGGQRSEAELDGIEGLCPTPGGSPDSIEIRYHEIPQFRLEEALGFIRDDRSGLGPRGVSGFDID